MNSLVSILNDAGELPSNVEVSTCLDCVHLGGAYAAALSLLIAAI